MENLDTELLNALEALSREHEERLSGLEKSLKALLQAASARSSQDEDLTQSLEVLTKRLDEIWGRLSEIGEAHNRLLAHLKRMDELRVQDSKDIDLRVRKLEAWISKQDLIGQADLDPE